MEPPVLSGNRRTDRALVALARLLAEIASNSTPSATGPHVESQRAAPRCRDE